jgi:hypothetical protein
VLFGYLGLQWVNNSLFCSMDEWWKKHVERNHCGTR